MQRRRASGLAFIAAGIVFLDVAATSPRRTVWLILGVAFLVLGAARLRRAAGS